MGNEGRIQGYLVKFGGLPVWKMGVGFVVWIYGRGAVICVGRVRRRYVFLQAAPFLDCVAGGFSKVEGGETLLAVSCSGVLVNRCWLTRM